MWSVGISVSPCEEAARLGYDDRQINRIVIRMAQYFLEKDMRVIFGSDWREDGVMRAVADYAGVVAARTEEDVAPGKVAPRMLNVVPEARGLSRAAIEAAREGGGVLRVMALEEATPPGVEKRPDAVAARLTALRHVLTTLLDPGCRVCLGGRTHGFQGKEPGVMEEARLAIEYGRPLYLMGGFGGATQMFGLGGSGKRYLETGEGLTAEEKEELFHTTDIERAIRLIGRGADELMNVL